MRNTRFWFGMIVGVFLSQALVNPIFISGYTFERGAISGLISVPPLLLFAIWFLSLYRKRP